MVIGQNPKENLGFDNIYYYTHTYKYIYKTDIDISMSMSGSIAIAIIYIVREKGRWSGKSRNSNLTSLNSGQQHNSRETRKMN